VLANEIVPGFLQKQAVDKPKACADVKWTAPML